MNEDVHNHQPLRPDEVRELLKDLAIPWWIAGGWAIDLFLGKLTREHEDIDILILRGDQLALQEYLCDWDLHKTQQPGLKPWLQGEYLQLGMNDIWCRHDPSSPWSMEFMLMDTEDDEWVYRREPRVRGSISRLGGQTDGGIPYLQPEIQLLYKAKPQTREKDQHDFDRALPHLGQEARQWLFRALSLQFEQGHEWIDRMNQFFLADEVSTC